MLSQPVAPRDADRDSPPRNPFASLDGRLFCQVLGASATVTAGTRTESHSKFASSRLGSLTSSNDASQLEPLRQVLLVLTAIKLHRLALTNRCLPKEVPPVRSDRCGKRTPRRLLRSTVPPASREAGWVLRCFGRAYKHVQDITLIGCNAAPGYPSSHAQEHRPSGTAAAVLQCERYLPRSRCMGCNTVES